MVWMQHVSNFHRPIFINVSLSSPPKRITRIKFNFPTMAVRHSYGLVRIKVFNVLEIPISIWGEHVNKYIYVLVNILKHLARIVRKPKLKNDL